MTEAETSPVPLSAPSEGLPELIVDSTGLTAVSDALAAGSGPVAVYTERASGYRYSQRV